MVRCAGEWPNSFLFFHRITNHESGVLGCDSINFHEIQCTRWRRWRRARPTPSAMSSSVSCVARLFNVFIDQHQHMKVVTLYETFVKVDAASLSFVCSTNTHRQFVWFGVWQWNCPFSFIDGELSVCVINFIPFVIVNWILCFLFVVVVHSIWIFHVNFLLCVYLVVVVARVLQTLNRTLRVKRGEGGVDFLGAIPCSTCLSHWPQLYPFSVLFPFTDAARVCALALAGGRHHSHGQ